MASLRSFILQRLMILPVTLFLLITVVFILLRVLPGANPVAVMNPQLPPDEVFRISESMGLNKPLVDQYFDFIARILFLDFGTSIRTNTQVIKEVAPKFAATLELSLFASLIGIPLGIFVGTYAGKFRETKRDHILRVYSIFVFSIPIFWLGINMQVIFSKIFTSFGGSGWIPSTSRVSPVLLEDIHKVTGIYFIDSLLFTGPSGYEFIYFLAISLLFIGGLVGTLKLTRGHRVDGKDTSIKIYFSIILIFLISITSLFISMYFNFESIEIFVLLPLLSFSIKFFLFLFSWIIWLALYQVISLDDRKYYSKPIRNSLIISMVPVIFYLIQGWFGFSLFGELFTNRPSITLFQNVASHLLLPGLALGMLISGVIARLVRMNMINTLDDQYIDASKARGIGDRKIIYNYALKNATVTSIPLIGLQFALLLGGAILTETTFSFEGLGRYIFQALQRKDYPQIQASVILFAVIVSIISIITDVIYALFDPRIRL